MPRPKHPKGVLEEQESFKQPFPTLVEELLEDRPEQDSRPVIVMTQEEGRFGRISEIRRCWSPKWIRPIVPDQ